jgi:guanylate cyclase soluble subunit beta
MIRVLYNDDLTYSLVVAAVKVLNLPASTILELFGQFFFEFCVESGYDKILTVLGSTTKHFLENLDALHDHLSTIYPGMKAPSFRCSETAEGNLVLHYYSDRPGLEFIVIGLVKTVASRLHKSDVECKVIKNKGEDRCDHVQFEIIEKMAAEGADVKADVFNTKCTLEKQFTSTNFMSPQSFCQIFPFHIVFDRQMNII